jgi:AcrR family transcriptional regulator
MSTISKGPSMRSSGRKDRRVERTRRSLRDALVSLIHEKSYDAIAVKEIVDRADVGRSAFYTHFEDKNALLASSIYRLLEAIPPRQLPAEAVPFAELLAFSYPVFAYVNQCHQSGRGPMSHGGRAVMHEHLCRVLLDYLREGTGSRLAAAGRCRVPSDLLEYVVRTFMQVLTWWSAGKRPLSALEIDDMFLSLVVPTLAACTRDANAGSMDSQV